MLAHFLAPSRPLEWPRLAGTEDKEHIMSQKSYCAIALIDIDIGKNSFHVAG